MNNNFIENLKISIIGNFINYSEKEKECMFLANVLRIYFFLFLEFSNNCNN